MYDEWKKKPYALCIEALETVLKHAWSRETASPGCQADWTPENPSYGQCAVTAVVLHRSFCFLADNEGTRIMRTEVEGFGSHYWLQLPDGINIDLTLSQFPEGILIPEGEERSLEYLLESERAIAAKTMERAELLDERINLVMQNAQNALEKLDFATR